MRDASQAVWGMLAAIFSALLVFGGLAVSLAESQSGIAQAPTQVPSATVPLPTQAPGEPTYTPSPTPMPTPTPTIAFPHECDYPPGWVVTTVGVGDTLGSIAERYQVGIDELRRGNCLEIDSLMGGMSIHVPMQATETLVASATAEIIPTQVPTSKPLVSCLRPSGWVIYYVRPGDNLFRIGLAVGVPYQELALRNCLSSYTIYTGQRLYVPRLPVFPVSPTPLPYISPTSLPPVASPTSIPPTNVPPTPVPPSATSVVSTATPGLPTATPNTPPPTQIVPSVTWTNTPPPPPATQTSSPTAVPSNTPLPPTATPLPIITQTSIPLPTRTPLPTIVLTPRVTLVPPTP